MEWISPSLVLIALLAIWRIVAGMEDRLARTERKLNKLLDHFKVDTMPGSALSDRVKERARSGAEDPSDQGLSRRDRGRPGGGENGG